MQSANEVQIRKCYECNRDMVGKRQNYRYTECGLNSVVLKSIIVFHCECGSIVPDIPAIGNLHLSIALSVLTKESGLLSAEEIRFVRKFAGYTAAKLAGVMGIKKEVISRWENGKTNTGKESDRLLRFACFFEIMRQQSAPGSEGDLGQAYEAVKKLSITQVEAATMLGVSRQFLVNLLENGAIPHHMVGSHRRIYAQDLLQYKAKRDGQRRNILSDLVKFEVDAGLYDRIGDLTADED